MSRDLRIDYVSPLPPTRSGISDYSRDLLPWLEPLCDLRVVRLPGQDLEDAIEARWQPVAAEYLAEGGRLPLYQMGNNRHHADVWRLAEERPGVLTLHDVVLHHLLLDLTLGDGDHAAYVERLEADHGWMGRTVGSARKWFETGTPPLFGLPAHRSLLRRQRGVLVHSSWAAEAVVASDAGLAVRVVPMAIPLPDPVPPRASADWRAVAGVPQDAPLIGSFGFQTPIKRTDRVIAAMASPALSDVHLVVAGESSIGLDFESMALEAGVADRVHVLGFLDYADFETAIAACDLCLNLRYPSAGETSASLLRVLALGRPVIVSDHAQFTALPDDVAVKVPLGEGEVETLSTAVGELLADKPRLQRMTRRARQYIEHHHAPERAAQAIVDACGELAGLEPPEDRPAAVPPPTSLLWRQLPGTIEVRGAEAPWQAGEARSLKIRLHNTGLARWLSAEHEIGGIMIDLHWRQLSDGPSGEQHWLRLPRDLDPGESVELTTFLRRPLADARHLVVAAVVSTRPWEEAQRLERRDADAVSGPAWSTTVE